MTLVFAIPSKGRLKEKSLKTLGDAGLKLNLSGDTRSYRGTIKGMSGVELAFKSASEIARELISGEIALGITGEDLGREAVAEADKYLKFKNKLGFGQASVVVAVPQAWMDVNSMRDLDDVAAEFRQRHHRPLRIATKYWHLTQNYFADHGIALYRIVESLGATEGAPAAGTADIIVDITSTGSTLVANRLKILDDGVILESEANLIASRKARLSKQDRESFNAICHAIAKVSGQ